MNPARERYKYVSQLSDFILFLVAVATEAEKASHGRVTTAGSHKWAG